MMGSVIYFAQCYLPITNSFLTSVRLVENFPLEKSELKERIWQYVE